MDQVNYNLKTSNAFIHTEKAVKKESQEKIEENVIEEIKEELRGNKPEQPEKMSALQVLAKMNQVFVPGSQLKATAKIPKESQNVEEDEEEEIILRDGEEHPEDVPTEYDNLVYYWNTYKDDEDYDWLLSILDNLVTCCQSDSSKYLEEAVWRSRRVQIRNKKRQKEYNAMLDFLHNGGNWNEHGPNSPMRNIQHWEIANGQYGYNNEDIMIIRQRLANLTDQNDPDATMRIEYNLAMVSEFTSKLRAIYVKLQDPIFDPENMPPRPHPYYGYLHELQMNIREFQRFISGYVSELQTLGWTASLPPDSIPEDNYMTPEQIYDKLVSFYNNSQLGLDEKIALVRKLIWYAQQLGKPQDIIEQWQNILNELNRGGDSSNASALTPGSTSASAKVLSDNDGGKSGSTNFLEDNLRDLPTATENQEIPDEEEDEDEDNFFVMQEKYDSMYEKYREEQEEIRQKDMLETLLNFVCRRIARSNENITKFWMNKYKALIAEWDAHGWEEFTPEYGLTKPF